MFQVHTKTMYRFVKMHVRITSLPTKQQLQGLAMIQKKQINLSFEVEKLKIKASQEAVTTLSIE